MFCMQLAGLVIQVHNHCDFVEKECRDFTVARTRADIEIEISAETIQEAKRKDSTYSSGYLESILIYTAINQALIPYQGFVLHASVIDYNGQGYAFLAPSGTGKSTQTRLWKSVYGDKCRVINGDKPIIRIIDGRVYAYGTPWCGKEGWNTRDFVELKTLLFLERGSANVVYEMNIGEIIDWVFQQVIVPQTIEATAELLRLLELFISKTKIGRFVCTREAEAVEVARQFAEGE